MCLYINLWYNILMADRNKNLRERYLNGERLFRKYIEMGESRSIILLTEWATFDGMTSSKGNKPTEMGVWKAIWRWASTHKSEAWNLVKGATFGSKHNRFTYNQERWEKEMIHIRIPSAWQHPTQAKKEKFMKEHGWI